MVERVYNFNAGPAVLPLPVLERAQAELLDYRGQGMSILEMSHRSAVFDELMAQVKADLRALLGIPDDYALLFLQGGASMQFDMLPMNLLPEDGSADYIINGVWGKTALKEARKLGMARLAASSEESHFDRTPDLSVAEYDPSAAYLYFTSNETIQGVQWSQEPEPPPGVPLVCDMSSDFLSHPIEVARYGLIYAGAQKNAGPAGVTIVIIRKDLIERVPEGMPAMLDYRLLAEKNSLHNTPPVFSIYIVGLVLGWLVERGGLEGIALVNERKAGLLYEAIDQSGGFYRGYVIPGDRSRMNVTFGLPTTELEGTFVREARQQGLVGVKGHRSVGGMRASIYNALSLDAVEALVQFMSGFQRRYG